MFFKKNLKKYLFAKKYLQNLTSESIILAIEGLQEAGYPSSLLKCFVVFAQFICSLREHFKHLLLAMQCYSNSLSSQADLLRRWQHLSNVQPAINIFL